MNNYHDLAFHHDPGHGWLEVPMSMLDELDIREQITRYSYVSTDGTKVYLEEDQDFTTFMTEVCQRFPGTKIDTKDIYRGGSHWIRSLPSYDPEMKEMHGSRGEIRINGSELFYSPETDPRAVRIIENHLNVYRSVGSRADRLIFVYGDTETGKPWSDPPGYYGSTDEGYVGCSSGPIKIPLAIHNSRSTGGGAILTGCIVKILTARGKEEIYSCDTPRASA